MIMGWMKTDEVKMLVSQCHSDPMTSVKMEQMDADSDFSELTDHGETVREVCLN